MCQSILRVMFRMLRMSSGQFDIACIRGKKLYKYCSASRTNQSFRVLGYQCIVMSCKVSFEFVCACSFFNLKYSVPINWHYLTDRLQRFELKISVCVLLKKQSHLHLGCPGGKQIHIFLFGWTIPLTWSIDGVWVLRAFTLKAIQAT